MSCLFRSIAHFFPEFTAGSLRQRVCDALSRNPYVFNDELRVVDDAYIERMRKPTTFGGAIEIKACCELLLVSIVVVNDRDHTSDIVFAPAGVAARTIRIRWSGNHYVPVVP